MLDFFSSTSLLSLQALVTLEVDSIRQQATIPFQDRVEFDRIADMLNRQLAHHVQLHMYFSSFAIIPYLKALLLYLNTKSHLKAYYQPQMIYLTSDEINDLKPFRLLIEEYVNKDHKRLCIAYHSSLLGQLTGDEQFTFFHSLQTHPNIRLIVIKAQSSPLQPSMQNILPEPLSSADQMTLLSYYLEELEGFHQITIQPSALQHALYLAHRYLPQQDRLANSLLLLDSATARVQQILTTATSKTDLTNAALNDVISCYTRIPATHLQKSHFNPMAFTQHMAHEIFGQDEASHLVARCLQQAFAGINIQRGPLLSLLLYGPREVGKKSFIDTLVKYLFDQTDIIYVPDTPSRHAGSLLTLPFRCTHSPYSTPLKTLITNKPYVVLCLQNIDQLSQGLQDELNQILNRGNICLDNHFYDFQECMILMTVDADANSLALNDHTQVSADQPTTFSLAQFVERPAVANHVDYEECLGNATRALAAVPCAKGVPIVPFLPLSNKTIGKVMEKRLNKIALQLAEQHRIEFEFAPEVIQHLLNQASKQTGPVTHLDDLMWDVYAVLEKVLLNRQHIKKLYLQLNETGSQLRCA